MSQNVCTEIAEFNVLPEIEEPEFIKVVAELEANFHSKQNGFIDTELLKGTDPRQWIMIQHWETIAAAKESSNKMMQEPVTELFRRALDPRSVKLKYLQQKQIWRLL